MKINKRPRKFCYGEEGRKEGGKEGRKKGRREGRKERKKERTKEEKIEIVESERQKRI